MSGEGTPKKPADQKPPEPMALMIPVVAIGFVLWIITGNSPIPSGKENREKAEPFLKEQFPDRELSPRDQTTAPVAVVFELIRSGKPDEARRALDFAREQQFGYGAPYAIDRLGSGDPELERSALDYLRTISGRDYGPDADLWRAWWRDPPKNLLVVSIGQTTLRIGLPTAFALTCVLLLAIGRKRRRPEVAEMALPLVIFAWFMAVTGTAMQLVGSTGTCTFGAIHINYYAEHGAVVGLEDARSGGSALWIALIGVWMVGGFALMGLCALAIMRSQPATAFESNEAKVL
jgi:hypothetical protein